MDRSSLHNQVRREQLRLAWKNRQWPSDALYVHAAYHVLLRRAPDDDGFAFYHAAMRQGRLTARQLLQTLQESSEYQQTAMYPISPLQAQHHARCLLFQNYLPPAEVIVDLGGASQVHNNGALLGMGYPHQPRSVTIVDLPPDQRLGGPAPDEPPTMVTPEGTHIRYCYTSMTDLSTIVANSVDLVVSGQSIEHISEADATIVCQEVWRVLRPGGWFCLDTPNAILTRILSPTALIHPEHQKEYTVAELVDKLQQAGFAIGAVKGLCAMPETVQQGQFDFGEMIRNIGVNDDPENSFLFYIAAQKPPAE